MGNVLRPALIFATAATASASLMGASTAARATSELDRKYALETIGALRSWDNVDGLFAEYVSNAYRDYFAKQSRFRWVDLSKADALFAGSKLPYAKAIEDGEILGQLSRSMRTQSLIRTRIRKEGPAYRFSIEWLHAPGMDVLASETFTLNDPGQGMADIAGPLRAALDSLFKKLPFIGMVTGRDENSVTVNLGALSGVKKGDTFLVATLDDAKKHPLLKQVVDWRLTPTGRVEVDQVDEGIAFCRVVSEEEGRQIARFQKITQLIPRPATADLPAPGGPTAPGAGNGASRDPMDDPEGPPRLGFTRASLWTGAFSRQFSSLNGAVGVQGGGFLYGARGEGQIWFNRELFADIELGYAGFGYGQNDLATGAETPAGGVSGSAFTFKIDAGYSFFLSSEFFGPKGWLKLGYLVSSYSLPISTSELSAPFSVKSLFLGLGGDFPLRGGYGARVDLDFGLINGAKETGTANGNVESSHNARLYMGGYYQYKPRITFQAGIEIHGTGGEFATGNSLSQRSITLMPSVSYYF